MEEFVAVAIQLFFEIAIQMLGSPGISWAGNSKWDRGCAVLSFHLFAGGLCGWISTLIAPKLLLPYAALRIGNLVLAPVLAALISYGIAKVARSQWKQWDPQAHALQAFGFAFFFGAARFAFGAH